MRKLKKLFRQARLTLEGTRHLRDARKLALAARKLAPAAERTGFDLEWKILLRAAELYYVRGHMALLRAAGI